MSPLTDIEQRIAMLEEMANDAAKEALRAAGAQMPAAAELWQSREHT